jgi:formyl-CoA transferase
LKTARPLDGIRVIDLTRVYSGPYCTFLMAQAGAEVIKVEPVEGESVRKRDGSGGAMLPFALLNANKKTLTLDMKQPEGIEVLERLCAGADVLVENFRPGVLARLGLTPERLAEVIPDLIVARNSSARTS